MKVNSRYVDFRGVNHKLVGGSVDLRILSSEREEILSSSVSVMSVGELVQYTREWRKGGVAS